MIRFKYVSLCECVNSCKENQHRHHPYHNNNNNNDNDNNNNNNNNVVVGALGTVKKGMVENIKIGRAHV